jgi:alpha-L-rhamnosidase
MLIQPRIRDGIMHAGAELRSIRGKISSAWEVKDGAVTLKLTLPPNTTAKVMLPCSNGRVNGLSDTAKLISVDDGTATIEADSGSYVFKSKL